MSSKYRYFRSGYGGKLPVSMALAVFMPLLLLFPCSLQLRTDAAEGELQAKPDCIYAVKGVHSKYGTYKGQLELSQAADGKLKALRVISFDTYKFEGLKVQEIWSGAGLRQDGVLRLRFDLKRADFLTRVDGKQRQLRDFRESLLVNYELNENKCRTVFFDPYLCTEELSKSDASSLELVGQDKRVFQESRAESFQLISKLASATLFLPAIVRYRTAEDISKYKSDSVFQKHLHYFVFDPTDFEFYRKNPAVLRVSNRVLDKISLVEASFRQSAYSLKLNEKMSRFESEMQRRHLNELGLYCPAICDENGKQIAYGVSGDGALWSGMYAGAEALRYLLTEDRQALENFRKVLKGMIMLVELTGDRAEFARTAAGVLPGEAVSHPWARAKESRYAGIKYLRGGNNDMIKGLYHAFVWAYEILPADDPLLARLNSCCLRLPELRIAGRDARHPGNAFAAHGLAALAGSKESLRRYLKLYRQVEIPADFLNLDKGYYFDGIADWSGVNLTTVSQLSNILIAKNLLKRNGDLHKKELTEVLSSLRAKLLKSSGIYASCRRDFLTIAAAAFSLSNNPALGFSPETRAKMPDRWQQRANESIWSLREMPCMDLKHKIHFDYRLRPEWCPSASPLRPWKLYVREWSKDYFMQGAFNYPLFEGPAFGTDNAWASAAFIYQGGADPKVKHGRFDYLFAYWLARAAGLISASD